MCGIHACVGRADSYDAILAMTSSARHRGPDSSATFTCGDVSLGFNRLSIIGGLAGEQPLQNADGSLMIIGNGEIFNYQDLVSRYDLRLRSRSDIEVIMALYQQHGLASIGELEGQFSFIIFDRSSGTIHMGRDRWGITPLYYVATDTQFAASSSIRSLYKSGVAGSPRLNSLGLAEAWGLYGPTPPRTCFEAICQLAPGYTATLDIDSMRLIVAPYTTPSSKAKTHSTEKQSLGELLQAAVSGRLEGEGPIGVYASGGLDSSVIAALACRLRPKQSEVRLFGIQFKEDKYNEGPFQQQLAEYLGAPLDTVQLSVDQIISGIESCVSHVEMPLIRTAPVPMMALSKAVRKAGVKWVLCGEGADELFAGYPVFARGLASVTNKQTENMTFAACFNDGTIVKTLRDQLRKLAQSAELQSLIDTEIATKLSRYLLTAQGDRMSMAHSVEQRFPFLDNAVSDYARSLSPDQLLTDGLGKQPIRALAGTLLPAALAERKKQGYLAPDIAVVQRMRSQGLLSRTISQKACDRAAVFDYHQVKRIYDKVEIDEISARFLLFVHTAHQLLDMMIRAATTGEVMSD